MTDCSRAVSLSSRDFPSDCSALFTCFFCADSLAVAARWRALTRKHARVLAARVSSSPQNFKVAQAHAIYTVETQILVGFGDILRFAGAHSAPGDLLAELRRLHSHRINRCVCRAVRLARDIAEHGPTGCEIFTVGSNNSRKRHSSKQQVQPEIFLCGCMENADTECRQWVGQHKRRGRGSQRGTTTARSSVKSKSHTATTRTWADTCIRQWDRDSDDDVDASLDSDSEIETGDNEDEFADGHGHGSVLCSLGFGLRRIMNVAKPRSLARSIGGQTRETEHKSRRSRQARAETVQDTSEQKSTYTKMTTTLSTASSSATSVSDNLTERPPPTTGRSYTEDTTWRSSIGEPRRPVEVLVKTDVLISSTLKALQKRFVS